MANQQRLKQIAVSRLEPEVQNLHAGELEYTCHALVELIEEKKLIHRGLSRSGSPVGYTIDTFSGDRHIVGEYSSEEGYFTAPFLKLQKDAQHARNQAPHCSTLYLFSSKPCDNSAWASVSAAANRGFPMVTTIDIFDSRRIAETVYDQVIVRNNLVEYFADVFPSLVQIWSDHIVTHALPSLPADFVPSPERHAALGAALRDHRFVAVYGVSGNGKTWAMLDYATQHASEYEDIIWLGGEDIGQLVNLRAIRVSRLGVEINLLARLRNAQCLLIVDDMQGDAEVLERLIPSDASKDTRVIVSCIPKPSPPCFSFELPDILREVATEIMKQHTDAEPDETVLSRIFSHVGTHPLTLAVIRDTVREAGTSWNAIIEDLEGIPLYETKDRVTILERVLLRHATGVADEIQILKWLGKKALDMVFLGALLGPGGMAKVLRRSILRLEERGMVRIHDIVFICIQRFSAGGLSGADLSKSFWSYYATNWHVGDYHFRRSVQINADKIEAFVKSATPVPAVESYVFLLIDRATIERDFAQRIAEKAILDFAGNRVAVSAIIEAIECLYQWTENPKAKEEVVEKGLASVNAALPTVSDPGTRSDLLHHRGKMLRWLNRFDEARDSFEQALAGDSTFHQSRLQLARYWAGKNDIRSVAFIEQILEAFRSDPDSVAITVVLVTFTELSHVTNQTLRTRYVEKDPELLRTAIALAVAEGFSQPYNTLARLGRYVYYDHPDVLLELGKDVHFPLPENASPRELFDIAECMKVMGKALLELNDDAAGLKRWCEQAKSYYDRMTQFKDFQLTMRAECLILLNEAGAAISLLDQCQDKTTKCHWWHRKAQALLQLNRLLEARTAIDEAIRLNKDAKYTSTFLRVRAEIEAAGGFRTAVSTMDEALAACGNDKFRRVLQKERASLMTQFA